MAKKKAKVKVSIIVPLYNCEQYVDECISSIINQTFKDLEVICIDDGSTDNTLVQVKRFAEKDHRVNIICHGSPQSASQARKDGVAAARGNYLMFVDDDDCIEPNLVERAYKSITSSNTDIVQFRTCVENCANVPEYRIESLLKFLNKIPLQVFKEGVLSGESSTLGLLEPCILQKAFGYSLWNKIFRAEICKRAFADVPDGSFPYGEDLLAMFHVLRCAKTYSAIEFVGYHYYFGRGFTSQNTISRAQFERYCQSVFAFRAIRAWVIAHADSEDNDFSSVLEAIRSDLLNELVVRAIDNMAQDDASWALSRVAETWQLGRNELFVLLAKTRFFECKKVAAFFRHREDIAYKPRIIRTVALYYRNIQNGGAQRVVCMVANRLAQLQSGGHYCYRVVLVTDDGPTDNEYALDNRVERYYVPGFAQSEKEMYASRAHAWRKLLDKTQVDVLIDSLWESPVSFWDALVVKSYATHPAVLFHCHNFFGPLFELHGRGFSNVCSTFSVADGIVTLSKADEMFWSSYCSRIWTIPNPCSFKTTEIDRTSGDSQEILWIGRISPEKQVGDIVRAMASVHERVPGAVCRLVGEGDERYTTEIRELVERYGLQKTVLFEGFSSSVEDYYRKAAVFCLASKYEGFALAPYEAAAFGVPTVMYELPWLEYNNTMRGGISVPQGDYCALADSIVDLLRNRERWQQCSDDLLNSSIAYQQLDVGSCWSAVLSQLEDGVCATKTPSEESKLLSLAAGFHSECIERYTEELSALRLKLQRTYQEKSEINAKLQRTYREKAERGARIKELQEQLENEKEKTRNRATKIDALKGRINELNKTLLNRVVRVGKRMFKRK